MEIWTEKNYGADADGNRGVKMTMFELDDSEEERLDIAEHLILKGYTAEDSGSVEITFHGIDMDVDVAEYSAEIAELEKDGENV